MRGSPTGWATAMAGECGEACNFVKKIRRDDHVELADVGEELADGSCVILGRLHPNETAVEGDRYWQESNLVEIVSESEDGSEADVVPL